MMRRALIFIFSMFMGFYAHGQNVDTAKRYRISCPSSILPGQKPLIIVDDKFYTGAISKIKPDHLESVGLLKDSYGTAVYGISAVNGVIVIKTTTVDKRKKSLLITSPLVANTVIVVDGSFYKENVSKIKPSEILTINIAKGDSAIKVYGNAAKDGIIIIRTKRRSEAINKIKLSTDAKIVLDEKQTNRKLSDINPGDVFNITLLSTPKFVGAKQTDTTILVLTKQRITEQYQKKLRTFSNAYKAYLDSNNGDDSHTYYTIDGEYIGLDKMKQMQQLYLLAQDKIDSVLFTDSYMNKGVNTVVCFITTKKP